jgi:hypothetical protein
MTLAASTSIHINASSMTQRTRRKRLSLPSTFQYTQPLSHAIYSNARTRRLRRHKPLFPWRHSTCSKETGWSDRGPLAVRVSLVGVEWSTMTTVVMTFMNATKITDWLRKLMVNWSTVIVKCRFELTSVSLMDCHCNLLTVQLALLVKWWSCYWIRLVYIGCSTFTDV